jgi:hypothetical protein
LSSYLVAGTRDESGCVTDWRERQSNQRGVRHPHHAAQPIRNRAARSERVENEKYGDIRIPLPQESENRACLA